MEYIESLLWLSLWPIIIFFGYKFSVLNLRHYQKMERLEELEERLAQQEK